MRDTIFEEYLFDVFFEFLVWPISIMEGDGFMTHTAASQQGAIKMFWLSF